MNRIVTLCLLAGWVSIVAPVHAKPIRDAAGEFAAGKALLAHADFEEALKTFKTAARKDAENQEYAQQYALLRQVIKLRKDCPREQDPERWLKTAGALRAYYYDHQIHAEALPLDQERYRRQPSAESAVLLAETQLALGRNSEAAETLGNLPDGQTSARVGVLHGLALARLGRIDEAKKLAEKPEMETDEAGPLYFLDLARVRVLLGNARGALYALTRSFQLTPPSQLDALKSQVKVNAEFSSLLEHPDFAQVLKTSSRVEESGCSKGPSCGQCPKRATCGQGKAQKSDD